METLGEAGGLKEVIYIAVFALYTHYHYFATKKVIVKKVFKLETEGFTFKICKKKNRTGTPQRKIDGAQNKHVSKSQVNEAYNRVENCLDVVQLARDIEALRLLFSIIWKKSQRDNLPSMALLADKCSFDMFSYFEEKTAVVSSPIDYSHLTPNPLRNDRVIEPRAITPIRKPGNIHSKIVGIKKIANATEHAKLSSKVMSQRVDSFKGFKLAYNELTDKMKWNYERSGSVLISETAETVRQSEFIGSTTFQSEGAKIDPNKI